MSTVRLIEAAESLPGSGMVAGRIRTAAGVGLLLLTLVVPVQALPFEPGEELSMSVSFLSLGVGDIQVSVRQGVEAGVRVWPIQLHAESKGLAGAFLKLNDTLTTEFDPVRSARRGPSSRRTTGALTTGRP